VCAEESRTELTNAIESIRTGRFQALPRELNRLHRNARRVQLASAVRLQSALDVVRRFITASESFESAESVGNDTQEGKQRSEGTPKIIIAQSYV